MTVTDTEYFPDVELEQDRVALPGEGGIETLVGLIEQLAPPLDTPKLTVPLNPFRGFNVMAEVAVAPMLAVWI